VDDEKAFCQPKSGEEVPVGLGADACPMADPEVEIEMVACTKQSSMDHHFDTVSLPNSFAALFSY